MRFLFVFDYLEPFLECGWTRLSTASDYSFVRGHLSFSGWVICAPEKNFILGVVLLRREVCRNCLVPGSARLYGTQLPRKSRMVPTKRRVDSKVGTL